MKKRIQHERILSLLIAVAIFIGTFASCNADNGKPDNEISLGRIEGSDKFIPFLLHLNVDHSGDINYPEIEPPTSLPVYKCNFMESTIGYAREIFDAFEFKDGDDYTYSDRVVQGTKDLKYTKINFGDKYKNLSYVMAYSNGSFAVRSNAYCCGLVDFDFFGKSDSEITDDIRAFVDKFNNIFHMSEYEVNILYRDTSAHSVKVDIKEKTTDDDANRIKTYNGITKRIIMTYEDGFSYDNDAYDTYPEVELVYFTDDYLEEVYEADISSWDDNKKKIDAGEGFVVPGFSNSFYRSSPDTEEDPDSRINDRIVETPVQIIYVYDMYGYYRPVYLYEKTSDTDRVFSVPGCEHVHSTRYYEATDPVVSLHPKADV